MKWQEWKQNWSWNDWRKGDNYTQRKQNQQTREIIISRFAVFLL